MCLWKAFHTFVHFFSHQFTENKPFITFVLIHAPHHWRFSFNPSLNYHASTRSSPPWNQRRLSACCIDKFKTLLSRPVGFSPRPLCVWSWSVPFLQLGHNVGGYSSGHLVNTRRGEEEIYQNNSNNTTNNQRQSSKEERTREQIKNEKWLYRK